MRVVIEPADREQVQRCERDGRGEVHGGGGERMAVQPVARGQRERERREQRPAVPPRHVAEQRVRPARGHVAQVRRYVRFARLDEAEHRPECEHGPPPPSHVPRAGRGVRRRVGLGAGVRFQRHGISGLLRHEAVPRATLEARRSAAGCVSAAAPAARSEGRAVKGA